MATSTKGTTERIIVKGMSPKQRKVAAVDAYQLAEARAKDASENKGIARDNVLAIAKDGDVIKATDGTSYIVIDKPDVPTNQHAKVVAKLAAEYGVTKAKLDKLYKDTAGSSHPREVKKV